MEILEDYTFTRRGRAEKYPYDEIFDGQKRRLKRGEDFGQERKIASVRNHLGSKARQRGKKLLTQIEGDDALVIQAVAQTNGSPKPRKPSAKMAGKS